MNKKYTFILCILILSFSIFVICCGSDDDSSPSLTKNSPNAVKLPDKFSINIPKSLVKSGSSSAAGRLIFQDEGSSCEYPSYAYDNVIFTIGNMYSQTNQIVFYQLLAEASMIANKITQDSAKNGNIFVPSTNIKIDDEIYAAISAMMGEEAPAEMMESFKVGNELPTPVTCYCQLTDDEKYNYAIYFYTKGMEMNADGSLTGPTSAPTDCTDLSKFDSILKWSQDGSNVYVIDKFDDEEGVGKNEFFLNTSTNTMSYSYSNKSTEQTYNDTATMKTCEGSTDENCAELTGSFTIDGKNVEYIWDETTQSMVEQTIDSKISIVSQGKADDKGGCIISTNNITNKQTGKTEKFKYKEEFGIDGCTTSSCVYDDDSKSWFCEGSATGDYIGTDATDYDAPIDTDGIDNAPIDIDITGLSTDSNRPDADGEELAITILRAGGSIDNVDDQIGWAYVFFDATANTVVIESFYWGTAEEIATADIYALIFDSQTAQLSPIKMVGTIKAK